jgi:hypothetical protein
MVFTLLIFNCSIICCCLKTWNNWLLWWTHGIAGDGEGYGNKKFNLPGPSWTTVCPWSQLGILPKWLWFNSKSENRWPYCHSWPFQTRAQPQYVHHLDAWWYPEGLGMLACPIGSCCTHPSHSFITTHPGCRTIQDATSKRIEWVWLFVTAMKKCVSTHPQPWRLIPRLGNYYILY